MYHDFLGREIEDLEGDNMRRDAAEAIAEAKKLGYDSDSLPDNKLQLHWLTAGYVSPEARKIIQEQGGRVNEINHQPPFIAVGLAYDPAGYWSWSHGQRQHRDAIEFWNSGEIQMERLTLEWGPRHAESCSIEETYLILPWEEIDKKTGQVKEQEETAAAGGAPAAAAGPSDDFDPFLDADDLP